MSEYNVFTLILILAALLLFGGAGYMIRKDDEVQQIRYEQCVSSGMQWHKGDCVK